MAEYAAFLRGINLGGHHRVTSDELRRLFEGIGLRDVATFRASGNVVFSGEADGIEERLAAELGFDVPVFLRSAKEVRAIAASSPFGGATGGKLQVAMLEEKPAAAVREKVLAFATDDDRLAFGARELLWLPAGRMTDSAIDLKAVEKLVGKWTMRTMGTVEQMASRYFGG